MLEASISTVESATTKIKQLKTINTKLTPLAKYKYGSTSETSYTPLKDKSGSNKILNTTHASVDESKISNIIEVKEIKEEEEEEEVENNKPILDADDSSFKIDINSMEVSSLNEDNIVLLEDDEDEDTEDDDDDDDNSDDDDDDDEMGMEYLDPHDALIGIN
eukprot:971569_1